MKRTILSLGVLALALVAVPPAFSASRYECLGGKPNIVGTTGDDVIIVHADENGPSATVNGKKVKIPDPYAPTIIFGDKGNDRISYTQDGGGPARACGGDGKDVITGTDIVRIHGGSGYDTADVTDQCASNYDFFQVETVRTHSSIDPGPCN